MTPYVKRRSRQGARIRKYSPLLWCSSECSFSSLSVVMMTFPLNNKTEHMSNFLQLVILEAWPGFRNPKLPKQSCNFRQKDRTTERPHPWFRKREPVFHFRFWDPILSSKGDPFVSNDAMNCSRKKQEGHDIYCRNCVIAETMWIRGVLVARVFSCPNWIAFMERTHPVSNTKFALTCEDFSSPKMFVAILDPLGCTSQDEIHFAAF